MASTQKKIGPNGQAIWQSRWREPGSNGKDRQRAKNFTNAKDAKAHAAKVEQEIERRGVGDPTRQSTEQYLRGWVALLERRGEHSPSTLSDYRRHIGLVVRHIGTIPLEKLSAADLDRAYVTLRKSGGTRRSGPRSAETKTPCPLKPRTVLHVHRMLHTALEQARKWKLISENPARDATAPSPGKTAVRAFTEDEVKRLLAAAAHDREMTRRRQPAAGHRAAPQRAARAGVGLRRSRRRDDHVRRAVIEVDYTPVLREQPKSDARLANHRHFRRRGRADARAETARFRNRADLGQRLRARPVLLFPGLGRPADAADENDHPPAPGHAPGQGQPGLQPTHGWRHTSATLLIGAGENLKTVQTRLGHSTPAITMALYVHPVDEHDRAAAERLGGAAAEGREVIPFEVNNWSTPEANQG